MQRARDAAEAFLEAGHQTLKHMFEHSVLAANTRFDYRQNLKTETWMRAEAWEKHRGSVPGDGLGGQGEG